MVRLSYFLIFLFVAGPLFLAAQSPYYFDWKKESIIAGIGLGTYTGARAMSGSVNAYDLNQINSLNRASVNAFDRVATFNNSHSAHETSDYLQLTAQVLPVLFLVNKRTRNHFHEIALLYAETYMFSYGLTSLTKRAVRRPRPFVFNEGVASDLKLERGAYYSFFSGHTSKTASMSFFTAKVYADFYPDSEWKPFVWAAAATIPAVTGYMRVKAGKHYPTDVITGYAVGALTGILVPHLHKRVKKKGKMENLRLSMGPGAANMTLVF